MNQAQLDEVGYTLREKRALKPCPRCDSNNFSIIGEAEITVTKQPSRAAGLLAGLSAIGQEIQTTMPIVIITCDNCGFVSQHATASLVKPQSTPEGFGLLGGKRHG